MNWMTMLAGALLLAGCQMEDGPVSERPDACGAADYAPLVGTNAAGVKLPPGKDVRLIGPDSMVTLDYRAERLNLRLNAAGTIVSADCG